MNSKILIVICISIFLVTCMAQQQFEKDTIKTSTGDLEITFIGHGTLMFVLGETVIHIDPWTKLADYSKLAKADLILITHQHSDHLDPAAIKEIRTESTKIVISELCADKIENGIVMKNGDEQKVLSIDIIAVPAYNLVHKRENGQAYHPQGEGNGYILIIGDTRVYIAGDTENTPEMKSLDSIDIAFLPMNLPYTMTPEMVADVVKAFKPKILYPYHYGDTDTSKIIELLKDNPDIEVRIRKMQ